MTASTHRRLPVVLAAVLTTASPLLAGYQFEFASRSDTFQQVEPGGSAEYGFALTNTGTEPDLYRLDCRILESLPGWSVVYCVRGRCSEPGIPLYDSLASGRGDTSITVTVYTSSAQGEESVNLKVTSLGNPALADSITTRTRVGSGIAERCAGALTTGLRVAPNPMSGRAARISFSTVEQSQCRLVLYSLCGRPVRTLLDGPVGPGNHELRWRAELTAGVYLLRLTTGPRASTCKVVIE